MRPIWLAILTIASFATAAVQSSDDCSAKLVRDRYIGAVLKGMASGALSMPELTVMAQAKSPVNPLAGQTPNSKNSGAIRLFETLAADPQVRANWEKINRKLNEIWAEENAKTHTIEIAHEATAGVVAPHPVRVMNNRATSIEFTDLDDGTTVMAYVTGGGVLNVEAIGKELPLLKYTLPFSRHWLLKWHRDVHGHLWLYLVANLKQGSSTEAAIFRLRWGENELTKIADIANDKFTSLADVSPQHLIGAANTQQGPVFYNFAGGKAQRQKGVIAYSTGTAVVSNSGKLLSISKNDKAGLTTVFKTAGGEALKVWATNSDTILVQNLENTQDVRYVTLPYHGGEVIRIKVTEWRGRIFVAAIVNFRIKGDELVFLAEPFVSPNPIYRGEMRIPANSELHWFTDGTGALLGAVDYTTPDEDVKGLTVFNPLEDHATTYELEDEPLGWFNSRNQTYTYVSKQVTDDINITTVYALFAKPGGGK